MADITASMVKELRERTGAGMMDCKMALTENKGHMEDAVDWLRKKGLAKAAKKAGRTAADGLIGIASEAKKAAVVEVNSETDFVARNDQFQSMVREVSAIALKVGGDFGKLQAAKLGKSTVEEHLKDMVATIGENMSLRRSTGLAVKEGAVSTYMHGAAAPGLGKIGVLVALESKADHAKLNEFGRKIAMHIAAANPQAVSEAELDPSVVAREKALYEDQAQQSGKAPDIAAKMAEGRLKKEFFNQVVLLQQVFVIDGKETVGNTLKAFEKEVGAPVKIAGFVRYALGEGIDKKTEDFAAEVAKMTKA
jgi:elongation factor Ts